jgi:hypothetical protein
MNAVFEPFFEGNWGSKWRSFAERLVHSFIHSWADLGLCCNETVLGLNQRYGKGAVHMASAGLDGNKRMWSMKQERRTPGYTPCWEDMPVARS